MAIDLAQFHDAFYEESFEALDSMEAALLKLDVGAPDSELINTIFRVAHSIKGGSATFGFKDIASFTHTLETLLDELRGQRMNVTQPLLDLLLKSVDTMRDMLRATQSKEAIDQQTVADLQFDLELAIAQKDQAAAPAPAAAAPVAEAPAAAPAVVASAAAPAIAQHRWQISFKPYTQLLAHGNDPVRLFQELAEHGPVSVTVDASAVPALADIDPEVCSLTWSLELTSEVTRDVVEHVFDWAEGECALEIREVGAPAAQPESAPVPAAATATPAVASPAPGSVAPVAAKPAPAAKPASPVRAVESEGGASKGADAGSIRVSTEKIDELMNAVGELVITQSMLSQLASKVEGPLADRLRSSLGQLERNMRELQESVMRVRMLPISFVFSRFPRMTRDLAQRLQKQIELKITGENTELDKTVMEKIGDPLVHLVRNCIDHGIESPADRKAAGKPEQGTVFLNAYHKGGSITIEVGDDGKGLAKDKIRAKAESRGLVGPNDPLTDEQIYELIFLPGFSTVEQATDLSGRGVGMDVVRRNIKELGGSVEIRSTQGKGSKFLISLPLTLAIVDGQSVAVGGENYIVPLTTIMESIQLKNDQVNRVVGRGEVFWFRDEYLPVIRLHEIFGVEPRAKELTDGLIMVVEGDGRRVGLFVDELLDQQQVVIKSLETNYGRVDGVSGATILGDGCVALILDVPGIIRVGSRRAAA